MKRLFSLIPIALLVALLVACGSAGANASGSANSATKTTTTNCLTTASGTIQRISSGGLLLEAYKGKPCKSPLRALQRLPASQQ